MPACSRSGGLSMMKVGVEACGGLAPYLQKSHLRPCLLLLPKSCTSSRSASRVQPPEVTAVGQGQAFSPSVSREAVHPYVTSRDGLCPRGQPFGWCWAFRTCPWQPASFVLLLYQGMGLRGKRGSEGGTGRQSWGTGS